eukprot:403372018
MKKQNIEKTMKKRKFFTEKRRLESQELQFFMMSADNRKLRVKHGANLFQVLRDQQQVNQQPLSLIETAIPQAVRDDLETKSRLNINNQTALVSGAGAPHSINTSLVQQNQSQQIPQNNRQKINTLRRVSLTAQHQRIPQTQNSTTINHQKQPSQNINSLQNTQQTMQRNMSQPTLLQNSNIKNEQRQSLSTQLQGILLSDYVTDTRFNPVREIQKERNIQEFFQQKYLLLNEYLSDYNNDDGDEDNDGLYGSPRPIQSNISTAYMRSRQGKKRYQVKRVMSQADLLSQNQLKQNLGNHYLNPKSRADQFIEQIEQQVVKQVDKEWRYKYNVEAEQMALKQEIQKISEQSKRRIQMFVDPRSHKIRDNFQVLNKNLTEIRKLDPNMNLLSKMTQGNRFSSRPSQTRISMRQSIDKLNTADWKHKSNAEVLNEILKIGRSTTKQQ